MGNIIQNHKYIVLSLAIILFSGSLFIALFINIQENTRLESTVQENLLWGISQSEPDLLRFLNVLDRFAAGDAKIHREDVVTRFDILWSRIDVLLKGALGDEFNKISGVNANAKKAMDILRRTETQVMSLQRGDGDTYRKMLLEYQGLAQDLHASILKTASYTNYKTLEQRNHTRDLLQQSAFLFTAVIISGGLLIFLLFREMRTSDKLLIRSEHSKEELHRQGGRLQELVATRTAKLLATKLEAENANRAKTEFLASMSHELRTPLNAIIGFSQVMVEGVFGDLKHPKYSGYAADINDSAQHLLEVINDILDLSKVEAGEIDIEETDVDIAELLKDSFLLVRTHGEAKCLNLAAGVLPGFPYLRADARLLRQVIINLLSNSIRFTPNGGDVTASARLDDYGRILLNVMDTGIGIAADDIAEALEPFGQIRHSPETTHGGTGLGLPLSKKLVELHGGTLMIDSVVGTGTAVTIRFPAERTVRPD